MRVRQAYVLTGKCVRPEALASERAALYGIFREQMQDKDTGEDEATGRAAQPDAGNFADFAPIRVADNGSALTYDERYSGLICRIGDELYERKDIVQADGGMETEKVRTVEINGAWISVPKWTNRAFDLLLPPGVERETAWTCRLWKRVPAAGIWHHGFGESSGKRTPVIMPCP